MNAQTVSLIQEQSAQADAVIEGKVLGKESFWNKEKTMIFTNNLILVEKTYKGLISDSIISIQTVGGRWDGVLYWSNNQIQIKVPSTDKKARLGSMPAGSGKFRITNNCNASSLSRTKLSIPYARATIRETDNSTPIPVGMACTNIFKFNTLLTTAENEFRNAITKWNQEISPNFRISSQSSNSFASATDNTNSVFTDNSSLNLTSDGAGLVTSIQSYTKCNNTFLLKDIDIVIDETSTSSNLLYGACLHELGHALGLSHSLIDNSFQDLMNYSKPLLGNTNIQSDVKTSADLVFPISNLGTQPSCTGINPIVKGSNCNMTKLNNNQIEQDIIISPNPISQNSFLNINVQQSFELVIFDILGKKIKIIRLFEGNNQIDIQQLEKGIYTLNFRSLDNNLVQHFLFTQKIVVQ